MSNSDSSQFQLKVLVVDDDVFITDILEGIATKLHCKVKSIHGGAEIGNALIAFSPDLIFLDLVLPDMDGVEVIAALARVHSKSKIVLISGLDKRTLSSVSEVARKHNLEVVDAISKPFAAGQVDSILSAIIESQSKVDPSSGASSTAQRRVRFGPQVLYEAEKALANSSSKDFSWLRLKAAWRSDDGKLADFDHILADAKKTGVSKGLIEFMLFEHGLKSEIFKTHEIKVGVKIPLSDEIFLDELAPEFLQGLAKEANLSNQAIMFEVSETAVVESFEATVNVLARLKIKGFKLAVRVLDHIDEVLAKLDKLPVDEITLDMNHNRFRGANTGDSETEFQIGSLVSYVIGAELSMSAQNVFSVEQLAYAERCKVQKVSGAAVHERLDALSAVKYLESRS